MDTVARNISLAVLHGRTGFQIFFRSIHQLLRSQGVALHISGMKLPVEAVLRRSGDLAEGPSLRLYRTDVEALAALQTIEPIHPETTP